MSYKCLYCNNFNGNCFNDIKRHLLSKRKNCMVECMNKNIDNLNKYNVDELFVYSIVLCSEEKETEDNKLLIKNIRNIRNYKQEVFDIVSNIYTDKLNNCIYCNKEFKKKHDLKNHIILHCFMNNKNKNNNVNTNLSINESSVNDSFNKNSIINSNNITNNITNYNINFESLVSFNEQWVTNHIAEHIKVLLAMSEYRFTELLEEILKNKNNLNIVVDTKKNDELGNVFVNENDKYIPMPINDILSEVMNKLEQILLDFANNDLKECKPKIDPKFLSFLNETTKEKKEGYMSKTEVKKKVDNLLLEKINNKLDESNEIKNKIETDFNLDITGY